MEDENLQKLRQLANRLECATSTGERVETLSELQVYRTPNLMTIDRVLCLFFSCLKLSHIYIYVLVFLVIAPNSCDGMVGVGPTISL